MEVCVILVVSEHDDRIDVHGAPRRKGAREDTRCQQQRDLGEGDRIESGPKPDFLREKPASSPIRAPQIADRAACCLLLPEPDA